MKSFISQSGPNSSTTTFLPARASTSANTAPEGPAPTMATSTFSCVAMSPPRLGGDQRHVRHAELLGAFDRAIDDVDSVGAEGVVDRALRRRALPIRVLVDAHGADERRLLGGGQLRERFAVLGLARCIDRVQRRAIKIHEWWTHVADADAQQRIVRGHRALLVDEM